jgi:hypothetical protein
LFTCAQDLGIQGVVTLVDGNPTQLVMSDDDMFCITILERLRGIEQLPEDSFSDLPRRVEQGEMLLGSSARTKKRRAALPQLSVIGRHGVRLVRHGRRCQLCIGRRGAVRRRVDGSMGVSLTSSGWTAGNCRQATADDIGTLVKYAVVTKTLSAPACSCPTARRCQDSTIDIFCLQTETRSVRDLRLHAVTHEALGRTLVQSFL